LPATDVGYGPYVDIEAGTIAWKMLPIMGFPSLSPLSEPQQDLVRQPGCPSDSFPSGMLLPVVESQDQMVYHGEDRQRRE